MLFVHILADFLFVLYVCRPRWQRASTFYASVTLTTGVEMFKLTGWRVCMCLCVCVYNPNRIHLRVVMCLVVEVLERNHSLVINNSKKQNGPAPNFDKILPTTRQQRARTMHLPFFLLTGRPHAVSDHVFYQLRIHLAEVSLIYNINLNIPFCIP